MSGVSRWASVFCGAAAALAVSTWGTQVALGALLGDAPAVEAPASGHGRWCSLVLTCPPYRSSGDHPASPHPGPGAADARWPVLPTARAPTGQPNPAGVGTSRTTAPASGGTADRPAHW